MAKTLLAKFWVGALVILTSPLCLQASAQGAKPLEIAEKNRVVSNKESFLILVLDLKPNTDALKDAGAGSADIIVATAENYAKDYLRKSEYADVPKVVVYLISVDSMDEYNRANFNGMKRFGTLTFERKITEVNLVENKLSYKP
jgi:hypothetical protein